MVKLAMPSAAAAKLLAAQVRVFTPLNCSECIRVLISILSAVGLSFEIRCRRDYMFLRSKLSTWLICAQAQSEVNDSYRGWLSNKSLGSIGHLSAGNSNARSKLWVYFGPITMVKNPLLHLFYSELLTISCQNHIYFYCCGFVGLSMDKWNQTVWCACRKICTLNTCNKSIKQGSIMADLL